MLNCHILPRQSNDNIELLLISTLLHELLFQKVLPDTKFTTLVVKLIIELVDKVWPYYSLLVCGVELCTVTFSLTLQPSFSLTLTVVTKAYANPRVRQLFQPIPYMEYTCDFVIDCKILWYSASTAWTSHVAIDQNEKHLLKHANDSDFNAK